METIKQEVGKINTNEVREALKRVKNENVQVDV